MIILGLDPGSTRTGYGLIKSSNKELKLVKAGILKISSKDKSERLLELEKSLSFLVKKHRPQLAVVEKLFFVKNIKTGIEVAQARGVLTLILAKYKIPVLEFSPSEIKIAVSGYGLADKKAVAKMVKKILGAAEINQLDDATDALAAAITGANKKY